MSPNNDYQIDIPTTFITADQTEIFYEGRKMEYDKTEIYDSEEDSFGFLETSIGIWKDSEEEEYRTTIGIGVKDYYKEA